MFCSQCGTSLPQSATFCKDCGAPQPPSNSNQQTQGATSGPQQTGFQGEAPQYAYCASPYGFASASSQPYGSVTQSATAVMNAAVGKVKNLDLNVKDRRNWIKLGFLAFTALLLIATFLPWIQSDSFVSGASGFLSSLLGGYGSHYQVQETYSMLNLWSLGQTYGAYFGAQGKVVALACLAVNALWFCALGFQIFICCRLLTGKKLTKPLFSVASAGCIIPVLFVFWIVFMSKGSLMVTMGALIVLVAGIAFDIFYAVVNSLDKQAQKRSNATGAAVPFGRYFG